MSVEEENVELFSLSALQMTRNSCHLKPLRRPFSLSRRASKSATHKAPQPTLPCHRLMAEQSQANAIATSTAEPSGSPLSPPVLPQILPPPEHCVICLDRVSEKAIALPCRHEQFDFPCLGTWLQRQQVCPLCKGEVKAIEFNVGDQDKGGKKVFYLPPPELPSTRGAADVRLRRPRHGRPSGRGRGGRHTPARYTSVEDRKDSWLDFRKHVYRHGLYSLHVGTNRISRYRNLTPASFAKDERLTSRARMWIRRELQVFDFLNSDAQPSSSSRAADRRASNADFLLEYIVAILKSIDLKGSTGQAEELLKDFLGRDNARLFLHELEAWLRSPYEYLIDWDRAVQYAIPAEGLLDVHETRSCQNPELRRSSSQSRSSNDSAAVPRWFSDRFVLGNDNARNDPT